MTESPSPAVLRRRLLAELRRLRAETGCTQKDVAAALDWSPSKLLRIENGNVGISKTDLEALLRHYDLKDSRKRDTLIKMAQAARKQPVGAYRSFLSPELARYYDLLSGAVHVRQFESLLVPGLMQTEDYATAVTPVYFSPSTSEKDIRRIVEFRLEQKEEIFDRSEADIPKIHFILDEAVLRRQVGTPTVMRRQLEEIGRLADHPKVTVQIIPFATGEHRGMPGPFQIIELEPDQDLLLYLENARGDIATQENNEETARYLDVFYELDEIASKSWQLHELINRAIAGIALEPMEGAPGAPEPVRQVSGDPGTTVRP